MYVVQNDDAHVVRTVPSCAQDAVSLNEDTVGILHVKTNCSPIAWVPVLVIVTVPKNKVASIQDYKNYSEVTVLMGKQ